MGARI